MAGKLTDIPKELVVSTTWEKEHLRTFFHALAKGNIFGYSQAFTLSQIKKIAWDNGVDVQVLPKSNALYKKYGEYVLRVLRPYIGKLKKNPRAHFEDIYFMEKKPSPGNRKCKGHKCTNTILAGEELLEITDLQELRTGRKAYVKRSLCMECAAILLKRKVVELLQVLSQSTRDINSIIKTIQSL